MNRGKLPPGAAGLIFTVLGCVCAGIIFFYVIFRLYVSMHHGRRHW